MSLRKRSVVRWGQFMTDRVVKATISDAALLEAIEAGEERHGSMAEAVRHALKETYAASREQNRIARAHKELVDRYGAGRIGLETAESTLAQSQSIPKDEVRSQLLTPMQRTGRIAIHQGLYQVSVVIGDE